MVLASNLLCRLPKPRDFLSNVPNFIKPGGHLVLVSPYSWLSEYTSEKEWVGGTPEKDSFSELQTFLRNEGQLELVHKEDIPFLIREHERKFQYGVSDCTVWKRI